MLANPQIELHVEPKQLVQKNISITNVRIASISEWDKIWKECHFSTYFHSREWAEIWSKYTKGRMSPTPFLVLFSDGKRALLPFSCLTKDSLATNLMGVRKFYISSPEYTYGGWISANNLDINHSILLSNLIIEKFGPLSWRLNPYDDTLSKSNIRISSEDETHAINLEKGFDVIVPNMSNSNKRAVRNASRNGVSVRISNSIEDWLDYYKLYEASVTRWGKQLVSEKYSWELFHEIFLRNSPNIELWLATYQDKVISGSLCFHSEKHFVAWSGASLENFLNLRPTNLLYYELIKHACEKGYTWFDFNPSAGLDGVKTFKKRFGAQALNAPIVLSSPKNIQTFTVNKFNTIFSGIKKQTNWAIPTPQFLRRQWLQINDQ